MATIKEINITRNYKEGFDLVQFAINELDKPYYWRSSALVEAGTSTEQIQSDCERAAKKITKEEIAAYRRFLEDGEKWGWD